jgi:hypothetical protein
MGRVFVWLAWFAVAVPVAAQAPAAKPVEEFWDAAYVDGARMGYQHIKNVALERDGKKYFRATKTLHLTLKRYNSVVTQRTAVSTEEAADGQVVALSMTQFLDKGEITQSGTVDRGRLLVRTPSDPDGRDFPWDRSVMGLYSQDRFFVDRKVKPGDSFRFLDYQLLFLSTVPMKVDVKDEEERDVLVGKGEDEGKAERARKKLLRVEVTSGKVKIGDSAIQLPPLLLWLDATGRPLRQESDIPGLGRLTFYRTTKAVAITEDSTPALLPDLGLNSIVRLNRAIDRPDEAKEIVYRISVPGDDDPATTFARDARQRVENVKGDSFELHVRPIREAQEVEEPGKAKEEFLQSSYFLDSRDVRVRKVARHVVGDETDPWRQGQLLERWVHENMKGDKGVDFARASEVLRDLTGDCRQHAMLLAALCRAVGVPSRTAAGLIYFTDPDKGPILVFHMWTEVWIKGQWLMLDATLGHGSVGASHLKIADSSWHDTQTLAPLLPVVRVMGRIRVEVVSVK